MTVYQGSSFTPELTATEYALFRVGVKVSAGTVDALAGRRNRCAVLHVLSDGADGWPGVVGRQLYSCGRGDGVARRTATERGPTVT